MKKNVILCREDFSDFPIGEFPYDSDHSAMGEYQYVVEEGYRGRWLDQVCNYTYRGSGPSWIITERDGVHYMESMRIEKDRPHRMYPTLETGKKEWKGYEVSVSLRRLSQKGMAGLVFCLNHSIDTLVFYLEDHEWAVLAYRHKEELQELARVPFPHDCDRTYRLSADCILSPSACGGSAEKFTAEDPSACGGSAEKFTEEGPAACAGSAEKLAGGPSACADPADDRVPAIVCSIDGVPVIRVSYPLASRGGKAGITADCPSRFSDFTVCTDPKTAEEIEADIRAGEQRTERELSRHPKMKLWKKIDLQGFGTSRQIRFGHLKGGDEWHIVMAQMQRRVQGDAYGFISCLTAIDLEGRVLWQLGEPSDQTAKLGKVSADMPLQVYDIDGDGRDEVIVGWDFEIRILDGATGAVKKSAKTPYSDDDDRTLIGVPYNIYAFERINPDGIRICNLRGGKRPADILIKDRYCRVYALDENLELLWKYKGATNTGHCPLPVDIDGDGRDEVLVGYELLDSDGTPLWHYPVTDDHTDEIVAGRWMTGDPEGYFACVSGTQGFFIGDFYGNIVARDRIGHAQRVSIANYCPEREGLQIAVSNFWGHQGVIFLYDSHGGPIWEMQNEMNGNILAPVNWDGDGAELILTNADPAKGGLLNGQGVTAVRFPDDGHPVLCCEAIDLTGDERDELVVWDYHSMYIYTQEDAPKPQTCHPVKFPVYNASNYRGEYSYPDPSFLEFHADRERMKR